MDRFLVMMEGGMGSDVPHASRTAPQVYPRLMERHTQRRGEARGFLDAEVQSYRDG
ncbi:MAG: hypothetical protein N2C14_24280 [Planctomycetales bacterium]